MLPAIGSALQTAGRLGVVLAARPVGQPEDGRQLVALRLKTIDGRDAQGRSTSKVSGLAPVPAESSEPPARQRALRQAEELGARRPDQLSAADRAWLAKLRQRDQQVRQEEKAHAAAAGDLAGPIQYSYQRGPDGQLYAVSGSVGIRAVVRSGDPGEIGRLAGRIATAATAPTNPSAQDLATARLGHRLYAQAGEAPAHDLDISI